MERDARGGAVEVEVLELAVVAEVVAEVAPGQEQIAPVGRVADAGRNLVREIGIAGADIGVPRHEPAAVAPEVDAAFRADDAVPAVALDVGVARLERSFE